MRRVVGILLLTGLLLVAAWPLPASAGGVQTTPATASQGALRADFNGDGVADLAIGAPGENNFSGVVHVLYGASPGRVGAAGSQVWSQNSTGIAGTAERSDLFGNSLAAGKLSTGGGGTATQEGASPTERNLTAPA